MKIKKNYFLVLITFFIALAFIFYVKTTSPKQFVSNQTFVKYSDLFFSYEITKYPSSVEIVSPQFKEKKLTIGLVTDPWNLNFGIIPIGSYGTRHLNISNSEKNKVIVNFNVYGNIKHLISFSKNNFVLNPNESIYIDVFLNTTSSTKVGNYTGEIDVIIKKPNFDSLYLFYR